MMDILNSPWLIKMLAKSSKKSHERLLNLFDILEDWLDAPHVRVQVENGLQTHLPEKKLLDFLALEAAKAGAVMPEMLASQLYFMAVAAAQEKLQAYSVQNSSPYYSNANTNANANTNISHASLIHATSFRHAKVAASALIAAQTKTEFRITKPAAYAVAASFASVFIFAGGLFILNLPHSVSTTATAQLPIAATTPQLIAAELVADPNQTAALIAQIEQMRHGNCQLIEAIQLPDSQKGIYINMIVNGQVSTNPSEQAIALDLLSKTRCNYTPMLMANSTG